MQKRAINLTSSYGKLRKRVPKFVAQEEEEKKLA